MSRKRKESRYCDNCKKYKKTKVLRTIDPQSINEEELSTKMKQIFEYR
ncbi:hypothetical protein J6T66_04755 [bacterium]|nr:hypothetical protein [bacterium]